MTTRILLRLYAALFISISFGVIFSFVFPLGLRIYPYDVPVILLAPLAVMFLKKRRELFFKNIYLLCFLFIGLVGLFFSLSTIKDLIFSVGYLGRLILYLMLAMPIFIFTKKMLFSVLKIAFLASVLFAVFGYAQYIYYPDLANLFYFGWDRHLYRLFSTFLDPNFAGSYLVFSYITSLGMIHLFWKKHAKRNLLLITLIFLPAILLTYSRTAYIMLVVSGGLFLYFFQRKLVIFSFLLFFVLVMFLPKNFGGEGVNLLRTSSIISRLEANEFALSVFIQNPIIGVGFNGLRNAYLTDGSLSVSGIASHSASGVPNSFLYILATTGVVGFGMLLVYVLQVFTILMSGFKRESEYFMLNLSIFAAFIGLLVASLFENIIFYSPIFISLVILVAVTVRLSQLEKRN